MPQRTNSMHFPLLPQPQRKEIPRRKVGRGGGRMVPTRPGAPGSLAECNARPGAPGSLEAIIRPCHVLKEP